jgi:hypothetical protein
VWILAACAVPASNRVVADDEFPERAVLHFPTPFHLEQTWVYNDAPPRFEKLPVVFLAGEAVDLVHGAQVVVAHESLLTSDGLVQLLTTGVEADDDRLLFQDNAPQYARTFTHLDVDDDGVDEVLLTGRGGAGGFKSLRVFAIDETGVRVLHYDGSKFGIVMIDTDEDDVLEIWHAGIDFEVDEERHMLVAREYHVYTLQDGEYANTSTISRSEAEAILAEHRDELRTIVTGVEIYE